jgi:hypothetical protein
MSVQAMLAIVQSALPLALAKAVPYGGVRIDVAQDMTRQISGPGLNERLSRRGASAGAVVALLVTIVVLVISLSLLYAFWRVDHKRGGIHEVQGKEGKHHHGNDRSSLASTVRTSAASEASVVGDLDGNRLVIEYGPSFDIVRDRQERELEEESSCLPDYVFDNPAYTDYLDSLYRENAENLEII